MGIFRDGNAKPVKINIGGLTKECEIMLCNIVKIDAVSFRIDKRTTDARTDKLTLSEARQLISKVRKPLNSVILIKKTDYNEIDYIISVMSPDAVQLQEDNISPEIVRSLFEKHKNVEFIKTIYVKPDFPVQKIKKQIDSFLHYTDAITIDPGLVDPQNTLNLLVCAELAHYIKKQGKHVSMAGNLNPNNMAQAVQIVKPDMVDVLTGICKKHKETKEPLYGTMDYAKVVDLARVIEKINN